jgi:hypothetical protein
MSLLPDEIEQARAWLERAIAAAGPPPVAVEVNVTALPELERFAVACGGLIVRVGEDTRNGFVVLPQAPVKETKRR